MIDDLTEVKQKHIRKVKIGCWMAFVIFAVIVMYTSNNTDILKIIAIFSAATFFYLLYGFEIRKIELFYDSNYARNMKILLEDDEP